MQGNLKELLNRTADRHLNSKNLPKIGVQDGVSFTSFENGKYSTKNNNLTNQRTALKSGIKELRKIGFMETPYPHY